MSHELFLHLSVAVRCGVVTHGSGVGVVCRGVASESTSLSMSACASVSVSATMYSYVCVCAHVHVHESPSAHAFAGHSHGPFVPITSRDNTRTSQDTDHGTVQNSREQVTVLCGHFADTGEWLVVFFVISWLLPVEQSRVIWWSKTSTQVT